MSVMSRNYIKLFMCRHIASCGATSTNWFFVNDNIVRHKSDGIIHTESFEPSIPLYVERKGENIALKKARLVYQSRKRGMLENGLVLGTFAKKYLDTFNEHQLKLYDNLINIPSNDWDLFYWATGVKETPDEFNHEIMDLLKKHVRNDDRKSRIVQPDL